METLEKDMIYMISKYLDRYDMFNLLTCNKKMYKYMSIYRSKYKYDYKRIEKNKEDYKNIIIRTENDYEKDKKMMDIIYYRLFCKYYYEVKYIETGIYKYKFHNVMVKKIDIDFTEYINLERLEFDNFFNQEIDFVIPDSIRYIKFGKSFNKSIDKLNDNIEVIDFGYESEFNQPIKKYPNKLKYIRYGMKYKYDINNLPDSVKQIDMSLCLYNDQIITRLPKKIDFLVINYINIDCDIYDNLIIYYNNEGKIKNKTNNCIKTLSRSYIKDERLFF